MARLFGRLGLAQNETKGCWEGTPVLGHLDCIIDTEKMRVFAHEKKVLRLRRLAKEMLLGAQLHRRLVSLCRLRHVCGVIHSEPLLRHDPLRAARSGARGAREKCEGEFVAGGARPLVVLHPKRRSAPPLSSPTACPEGARPARPARVKGRGGHFWDVSSQEEPKFAPFRAIFEEMQRFPLCRKSLRDLRYWRTPMRGEGRDLVRTAPDLTMHSGAADLGYGGMLSSDVLAGSRGFWEGQGFRTAADGVQSIVLWELRAVRMLLQRHFAAYVSRPDVRKLLMHENNQAVCFILIAMVSSCKPMMAELRRLHVMMRKLGVSIEARWIPSAVNRFADALSRT